MSRPKKNEKRSSRNTVLIALLATAWTFSTYHFLYSQAEIHSHLTKMYNDSSKQSTFNRDIERKIFRLEERLNRVDRKGN